MQNAVFLPIRRLTFVAVGTIAGLVAPLLATGATPAVADVGTAPTLAQFLVPDGPERHPDDIARLLAKASAAGITVDAARLQVYEVPTVHGRTRYVTDAPEAFVVSVNRDRVYRYPTVGDVTDLESSLGPVTLAPDGRHADVSVPTVDIPTIELVGRTVDDLWETVGDVDVPSTRYLTDLVADLVGDASREAGVVLQGVSGVLDATVLQAQRAVADALLVVADALAGLPTTDAVVHAVLAAAGPTLGTADGLRQWATDTVATIDVLGLIAALLAPVPTDPADVLAELGAILDQAGDPLPPVDPIAILVTAEDAANEVLAGGWDTTETVYTVVPTANAALPVNPDTLVAQPTTGLNPTVWNYAPTVYEAREDEAPPPARWERNAGRCFETTTAAWFRTTCWYIWNQMYDRNNEYSYWQFHMEASSTPRDGHYMKRIWVEGKPMTENRGTQYWDEKVPEPNTTLGGSGSSCTTQTKGLQIGSGEPALLAYHWEVQYQSCEYLMPKQYGEQGHWATIWYRNGEQEIYAMRHTAFTMAIRTKTSDDLPGWFLYDGTEVNNKWRD